MTKRTKTKKRWMWVHYGLKPAKAEVFWSRNGLAVTRVGDDEFSLTHVMTGNRIAPRFLSTKPLPEVVAIARVLAPLYDWRGLSFHQIIMGATAMAKRSASALKKAGLL